MGNVFASHLAHKKFTAQNILINGNTFVRLLLDNAFKSLDFRCLVKNARYTMDYVILDDFEVKQLEKKVNDHIQKGFKPLGNVSAVVQGDGFVEYLQAMVKEES